MEEELTIRQQVESMQASWPCFNVLQQTRWFVCWEGIVRPFSKIYRVRIFLKHKRKGKVRKHVHFPPFPRVTVVDPFLHSRKEDPSANLPHHYPNRRCPQQPFLCLYDPKKQEWDYSYSVSDTIAPWTIEWLACYEGWLATGEWTGGGRHD